MNKLKVLYVTTECKPFSYVGGLGDVAGELPPVIKAKNIDIEIITPLYGRVKLDFLERTSEKYHVDFHHRRETLQIYRGELKGVPVCFLRNKTYFEGAYSSPYIYSSEIPFFDDILRFSFFAKACIYWIRKKEPDIVHANDWMSGYLFGEMALRNMRQRRVLTIHNIGYQGVVWKKAIEGFPVEILANRFKNLFVDPLRADCINALRLGLELCHKANTVSPNHCSEITQPAAPDCLFGGGQGLNELTKRMYTDQKLIGILNGMEYSFEPSEEEFKQTLNKKAVMNNTFANFEIALVNHHIW